MILPQNVANHISSIVTNIVDRKPQFQLHDLTVYENNHTLADYRIRLRIASPMSLCKYLKVKQHSYIDNIHTFYIDVSIYFAGTTKTVVEQVVDSIVHNALVPLFDALEEFNFDKEVDKLLVSEYN